MSYLLISHVLFLRTQLKSCPGSSDSATVEKGHVADDPLPSLAFNIFAYNVKKCLGKKSTETFSNTVPFKVLFFSHLSASIIITNTRISFSDDDV